jgi:putative oxidoreductase
MDVGLLVIHVLVGTLLPAHGAQKLFGWFGGFGLEGTAGYMESLGLRPGRAFAAAAGVSELVSGLGLALGLLTPFAAALVAATMIVASRTDHRGKGAWIFNGGSEYVATVAVVALGLAFNGAVAWSIDAAIGWDVAGVWWGIGAAVAAIIGAYSVLGLVRREPAVAPDPAAA